MRRRICLAVMLTAVVAFGFLKSVDIEPVKASWSGWTGSHQSNNWIAQTITANFDSVSEAQLFVGVVGDTSHHYGTWGRYPYWEPGDATHIVCLLS